MFSLGLLGSVNVKVQRGTLKDGVVHIPQYHGINIKHVQKPRDEWPEHCRNGAEMHEVVIIRVYIPYSVYTKLPTYVYYYNYPSTFKNTQKIMFILNWTLE